jgi:deoxycytidylate deaminase
MHVIHQCTKRLIRQKKSLKKYAILVIRIKRDTGELVNSKPCYDCINTMKKCGIKKVYYSNSNGEIVMERVSQIENRKSNGYRNINNINNYTGDKSPVCCAHIDCHEI